MSFGKCNGATEVAVQGSGDLTVTGRVPALRNGQMPGMPATCENRPGENVPNDL